MKDAVEGGDAVKAGFHGDGRDGLVGVCQEILRAFKPLHGQVLHEAALNGLLEHPGKIAGTKSDMVCDGIEGQVLLAILGDVSAGSVNFVKRSVTAGRICTFAVRKRGLKADSKLDEEFTQADQFLNAMKGWLGSPDLNDLTELFLHEVGQGFQLGILTTYQVIISKQMGAGCKLGKVR